MYLNYTEDSLIEQPTIALFLRFGWQTIDCYDETFGPQGLLGRETSSEIVLLSRLLPALRSLNPSLPPQALDLAVEELLRDRSLVSLAEANQQIYTLLKDGVKVTYRDPEGTETVETMQVIDWEHPDHNDFLLASQLWITGELHTRRPDLVGFVNGLPLLLVELKAAHVDVKAAFDGNLRDYKDTIPPLFWYNAFIILSNGSVTRVGSLTAEWEHFSEWKKVDSESEPGLISLETALRGLCRPGRLLDLVENFTLFKLKTAKKEKSAGRRKSYSLQASQTGLEKIIAKNHQYLGVNNAFHSVQSQFLTCQPANLQTCQRSLGVFWHTQGSGKSYSMVFFAQKVLRKLPGDWTFVVVTDRNDLDDQIFKNFVGVGAVTEPEDSVRASSGEHLKQLLQEDHRYVFTLIQKFRTEKGEVYPALSQRSNIIVMTDEAHRSQYDVLALNMRNALPNAAFIGFTGTPLMAGEELTRQVFGDYVSIYNFKQSVDDQATVPLYYENRIPELQLTNQDLNQDMERLLEVAELDESQEQKLEREFSREYHLITRDDRLDKIADDIVFHFLGRGFQGKAMVVSIDKATALRMYGKVRRHWLMRLAELCAELEACEDSQCAEIEAKIQYMRETDMSVVISQGQNEIDDMRQKGLDIKPHRKRMLEEDLDTKFKDPGDPLRIVFVCAMWMTGFDVPSCSTIYLDKPMRNHTLMQTIARANRVWGEKVNGLIVDYIGVFRDLQKALAIYGSASGGGIQAGEMPVETKQALIEELRSAIAGAKSFLSASGVHLEKLHNSEGFQRVRLLDDAVEAVLVNDDSKSKYLDLADRVERLFQAILPDFSANEFGMDRKAIQVIAQKIRSLAPKPDISEVMQEVEDLLDESISPVGYVIHSQGRPVADSAQPASHWLDLSQVDFEALKRRFEQGRKRIEAEKLRGLLNSQLRRMLRLNKSRIDYYQQFQRLIDEYNSGAKNVDAFFAELVALAQDLNAEEQRGIAEQLDEEQLALFDLLTRPNPKLNKKEKQQVKQIARDLLDALKAERLVLDWRKRQQTRAAVQLTIQEILDKLPEKYDRSLYTIKCQAVYQHIYDSYYGLGKSLYSIVHPVNNWPIASNSLPSPLGKGGPGWVRLNDRGESWMKIHLPSSSYPILNLTSPK